MAQLEAEQEKLAEQLAALRRDEQAAASTPALAPACSDDNAALAQENARLKEQLAAMASASAHKSTVKRAREEEDAAALLKKYTEENAKLTAALATGEGLSELTAARPSASVIAASHARSASLVSSLDLGLAILAVGSACLPLVQGLLSMPAAQLHMCSPSLGDGSARLKQALPAPQRQMCVSHTSLLCRQAASPG